MVKPLVLTPWIWSDRGAKRISRERWPLSSKFAIHTFQRSCLHIPQSPLFPLVCLMSSALHSTELFYFLRSSLPFPEPESYEVAITFLSLKERYRDDKCESLSLFSSSLGGLSHIQAHASVLLPPVHQYCHDAQDHSSLLITLTLEYLEFNFQFEHQEKSSTVVYLFYARSSLLFKGRSPMACFAGVPGTVGVQPPGRGQRHLQGGRLEEGCGPVQRGHQRGQLCQGGGPLPSPCPAGEPLPEQGCRQLQSGEPSCGR